MKKLRRVVGLAPGQRKFRILVVDNLYSSRDVLMLMLAEVGFHPREAINGKEAIAIFDQWHPDVILMDVMMPGMDGKEATKRIKAMPGGDKTAIIFVSANFMDANKETVIECGAYDFIPKPFREAELFEKLHKAIGVEYILGPEESIIQEEKLLPVQIRHES